MSKTIGVILALKDKCSPQLKAIADRMGVTEKEAKRLNSQVGKLSRDLGGTLKNASIACAVGIGAVAVAGSQLVVRTVEAGDRIDELSQSLGMSRTGFQEWEYVLNQSSVEMEDLKVGMKTLTRQMMDSTEKGSEASKIFKVLGVSAKDNRGHFRKQEEVFNDVMIALQKMPNGIQKAAYAQKLFGKSGQAMLPALNSQAQAIDEVKERARSLGIVLGDDVINNAAKMDDTMKDVQRTFGAIGLNIGGSLIPAFQSVGATLVQNMPQIKAITGGVFNAISNSIKFLIDNMNWLIPIATGVVSTLIAFNAINGVITTIQTLRSVIQAVSIAQGVWNALMIANPIGAIAVGVGLVIGGIVLLVQNWDKVTNACKRAFEIMKRVVALTPAGMIFNAGKQVANNVKKHATGTSFSSGGPAIVGENGPELKNLDKGDSITPANKTKKLLGGTAMNLSIIIQGNMIGNNEFLTQLENRFAMKLQTAMQTA